MRQPLAFIVSELFRRDGRQRVWGIRGTRDAVAIRSGSADFDIFEEIFRARTYDPVPEVREALARLDRPLVVLDAGANIGLFSIWVLNEFAVASIRLVEPDPANVDVLEATIAASNRSPGTLALHPVAAGTAPGSVAFRAGGFQMSRAARTSELAEEDLIDVPVIDVLPLMRDADLVKLDIEGAEWAILADERLRTTGIRALVVEYHLAEGGPDGDLATAAENLLRSQGFAVKQLFWNPPHVGQLWAWREP